MWKVILSKEGIFKSSELFIYENDLDIWIAENKPKTGLSYEKVDLSKDPAFILEETRTKRRNEYPSELEIIEALMEEKEGRPEKLQEVLQKRDEIKKKYPILEELKKGR